MFRKREPTPRLDSRLRYGKSFLEPLEDRRLLAANIVPVNSVPLAVQTTEVNKALAFTSFRENLISTSDGDAGSNHVEVTLNAVNGSLSLITPDPNGGLLYLFDDVAIDAWTH